MVVTRSIFLKGVGLDILWVQLVPLVIMGVFVITLSAAIFRKSMT